MIETVICLLSGYLVGSLNPSALISKIKNKNMRAEGTGNLGATNTLLVFGKKYAFLVLLFDMAKSFLELKAVEWIFPTLKWLALATGLCAVIGHCFPFYLGFKGGKGLAAFAGLVLAYKPTLFLFLLVTGVALMFVVNYSFILPFYASAFFAVFVAVYERDVWMFLIAAAASAIIMVMHFGNIKKAIRGEDNKVRDFVKNKLFKSKKK